MNVELPREGEGQMSYPPYSQAPHIKIWLAGLSKKMLAVPNLFGGKFLVRKTIDYLRGLPTQLRKIRATYLLIVLL